MIVFKGREVEVTTVHPTKDSVDSYIDAAFFTDNGQDLSEQEIEQLQQDRPDICELGWFEHQLDRADRMLDEMREERANGN